MSSQGLSGERLGSGAIRLSYRSGDFDSERGQYSWRTRARVVEDERDNEQRRGETHFEVEFTEGTRQVGLEYNRIVI